MWEFQRGRTVRGESEEPVAIETELGCVLSGPLKRRYEFSEPSVQEVSVNVKSQDSAGLDKATIIVKNVGKVTNFYLFFTCPPRPWINVGQN